MATCRKSVEGEPFSLELECKELTMLGSVLNGRSASSSSSSESAFSLTHEFGATVGAEAVVAEAREGGGELGGSGGAAGGGYMGGGGVGGGGTTGLKNISKSAWENPPSMVILCRSTCE